MAEETAQVEKREAAEVRVLRDRVEHTVEELERRGRALMDWRRQLRKHALAISVGVGVTVLALGVVIGLPIVLSRRPRSWWQR